MLSSRYPYFRSDEIGTLASTMRGEPMQQMAGDVTGSFSWLTYRASPPQWRKKRLIPSSPAFRGGKKQNPDPSGPVRLTGLILRL